jgi:hypothetical protein
VRGRGRGRVSRHGALPGKIKNKDEVERGVRSLHLIHGPLAAAIVAICLSVTVSAQERPSSTSPEKHAFAHRVADGAIRVDGHLDEQAWKVAPPVLDFIQKEPVEGAAPSERMEVRFAYDADALYVGFRMWSHDGSAIQSPLGRRDSAGQAEHVMVSLDTYHDRRTAYTFGVTASGVRIDHFHAEDQQDGADAGFDPVWEARTSIDRQGWSAELWIPFSQLRFNDAPRQIWGLNIARFTPTLHEDDYWVVIPRTVTAWASRFGDLGGLDGVRPTRRLELLPYVTGTSSFTGARGAGNPFDDGRNLGSRAGVDLKLGIGSSLTLDATVNPDFGQVEADPAEVNLTAFETIFPEKRPFFAEGARLMNLVVPGGQNLFNSRRIGARPIAPANGEFVDYPQTSTILLAAKLTGRTASGTSVGVLGGITDRESARVFDSTAMPVRKIQVAPRTQYGLGRIQQELGRSGSTASVMGTFVSRGLQQGDALAALLPRMALGIGGDAVLRFKNGEYEATLLGVMSHVTGDAAAIERLQRTSAHYFQRPDRVYSRIDPTRTSLNGFKTTAGIERRSGRHWLWETSFTAISPGLETNDIGRTLSSDGLRHGVTLRYRETRPGSLLRGYSYALNMQNEWSFDKIQVVRSFRPSAAFTLKNFWTATATVTRTLPVQDLVLTRGGPLMQRPAGWNTAASLSNASTAQTRWTGSGTIANNEDGGHIRRVSGAFSFRPGPRWQLSIEPAFDRTIDVQQYVATLNGGRAETYGRRYVFSSIDRTTLSSEIRMGFTLRPDLNVDIYTEPFASSGRYFGLGELRRGGARERILYGTSGTMVDRDAAGNWLVASDGAVFELSNPDFSVRSLRSNVVLRWEWRPGSTLYLVWQQDRELREGTGARAGIGDLFGSFSAPGRNFLAIKTSFWLPID